MSGKAAELFDKKSAGSYDERFDKISAIKDNLHLLIRLVLDDLPADACVLCVGAGTGTEIVELATAHPGWRFKAVEPSQSMLDICREKLSKHGLTARCELVHGYLSDLPPGGAFDAVLCLLVTQFVKDDAERQKMFDGLAGQLRTGGYLVNAEISYDMSSPKFRDIVQKWKAMHRHAGATEQKSEDVVNALNAHVAVVPPVAIERYLQNSGFSQPMQFFQSLLIHAWYSRKN